MEVLLLVGKSHGFFDALARKGGYSDWSSTAANNEIGKEVEDTFEYVRGS